MGGGNRTTQADGSLCASTRRISWKARALAAETLLARQMWLTAEEQRGCDSEQAVEEWDNDRLLTSVYEKYVAVAQEAIEAQTAVAE